MDVNGFEQSRRKTREYVDEFVPHLVNLTVLPCWLGSLKTAMQCVGLAVNPDIPR